MTPGVLKRLFPKKTIPSSCFGEYKCCYLIWNHQIHILITISCVKTLHVLQNQSFFRLFFWFMLFLVTASCKFVLNYVLKIVIIFAFCMISLPNSSKYVLIDISSLTHFLCRNSFVMTFLILSAISANVLEIRLPITDIYPFTAG